MPPLPNINLTPLLLNAVPPIPLLTPQQIQAQRLQLQQMRLQNQIDQERLQQIQSQRKTSIDLETDALRKRLGMPDPSASVSTPQIPSTPLSELRQPNNEGLSRTNGLINGRAWQMLPDAEKAGYLMGLGDVVGWIEKPIDPELIPTGLIVNEIEAAVDHFYTEPPNLPIPVIRAVHIVALKALGVTPEEIQKEVGIERVTAN
jgi:hypothetical protein